MNLRLLAALITSSIILAGCADRVIKLTYEPIMAPPPIPDAQPLTVFAFEDKRGGKSDEGDPLRVGGTYGGDGNRLSKAMVARPFMPTLVNAVAEGFKAPASPLP